MLDKSTLSPASIPSGAFVVPEWLDWNFPVTNNPFDETTNSDGNVIEAAVIEKQNNIENHVRQELASRGGAHWSIHFVWTVVDTLPLAFNMKATIFNPNLGGESTTLSTRGSTTPPPPPQPPPPSL